MHGFSTNEELFETANANNCNVTQETASIHIVPLLLGWLVSVETWKETETRRRRRKKLRELMMIEWFILMDFYQDAN